MKKYLILTSVLALAACGGGSGGGGEIAPVIEPAITKAESFYISDNAADDAKINYVLSRIPNAYDAATTREEKLAIANERLSKMHEIVQQYINLYNSNMTEFNEFIANNTDAVDEALKLFWSNCSSNCGQISTYISQATLDNFERAHGMIAGEMTPNDMTFNDGSVKLYFENGKVVSIQYSYDENKSDVNWSKTEDLTQSPYYDPDTWPTTATVTNKIALFGSQVGLKYSDFGYDLTEVLSTFANGSTEEYTALEGLYGGYIPKELDKPNTNMVFNGTAVAPVVAHTYDEQTQTDNFYSMISVVNDATLTLQNNKEILQANFNTAENPWYNLIITQDHDDKWNDKSVVVSGDSNKIPEIYRIQDGSMYNAPLSVTYYGDNGVVSEVVAGGQVYGNGIYHQADSYTHEVDADVVFGGIKQ